MSEAEARLRVGQAVERATEIRTLLATLQTPTSHDNNTQEPKKQRKIFMAPQELSLQQTRWNNCCIQATKHLYGLNQKVTVIKRQLGNNQQDISTVRLLAQAALTGSSLLKGLIQFPDAVRAALRPPPPTSVDDADVKQQQQAVSHARGLSVVPRVLATCSELLHLMDQAGIITQQNEGPGAAGESLSSSLVESDVVQALETQGSVARHLAELALSSNLIKSDGPLQGSDVGGTARPPVLGLPHGRSLHLLHDSLSHRLAAARHRQQRGAEPVLRLSSRPSLPTWQSSKSPLSSRPPSTNKQKTLLLNRNKHKSSKRLRVTHANSSHKINKNRKRRQRHDEVDGGSEGDESDLNERERLWQELMPLLVNQEVVLHGPEEHDWQATLRLLDSLMEQLNELESSAKNTQRIISDSRGLIAMPGKRDKEDKSLGASVLAARRLLKTAGFLPAKNENIRLSDTAVSELVSSDNDSEGERSSGSGRHARNISCGSAEIEGNYHKAARVEDWRNLRSEGKVAECSHSDGEVQARGVGHGPVLCRKGCQGDGATCCQGFSPSRPGVAAVGKSPSLSCLDDLRRRRERLWTSWAQAGCVDG